MVNEDNQPVKNYPKIHNWKTSLHSFEHALFGYMTASRIKNKEFVVYYVLPETVVFFVVFVLTRQYCGGYHADTRIKCSITFILCYLFVLIFSNSIYIDLERLLIFINKIA